MLRYVAIEIDGKDEHATCRFRGTWATIKGFVHEMVSRQARGRMNMTLSLYEVARADSAFSANLFYNRDRPFTLKRLQAEFIQPGDLREVPYVELHREFPEIFPLQKG